MLLSTIKLWLARIHPLWFLSCPTLAVVVIVSVLMNWPMPVLVHVELTTQRVEFVVDAAQALGKPILNALDVRSVGIEKFSSIAFEPKTINVADPSEYRVEADTFPPSAWKQVTVTTSKVRFDANDITRHPRITAEGIEGQPRTGLRLDPISVSPGVRITVETRGGKNEGLSVKVAGQSTVNLSLLGPFALIAEQIRMSGISGPFYNNNAEVTYRVRLRESAPWIEIVGQPDGLVILPALSIGQAMTPVSTDVAVATLEFTRQDPSGERVSALTGKGLITFLEYPQLGSLTLSESEAVGLERLDRFSIKELALSPSANGITLVGEGMAGQIRTLTGQISIKRHLTAFDALKHNSQLMALFAIIVWAVPTTIAAYRLFKDFKR